MSATDESDTSTVNTPSTSLFLDVAAPLRRSVSVKPEDTNDDSQSLSEKLADVIEYLKDDTLYLAQDSVRQTVHWLPESRGHRLIVKDSKNADPAILTLIGRIGDDDCFLASDGAYKGRTDFTSSLADVKLSCVCRRPVDEHLAKDFSRALVNLTWLMDKVWTPGQARIGVTLPVGSSTPTQMKVRHILFRVSDFFMLVRRRSHAATGNRDFRHRRHFR